MKIIKYCVLIAMNIYLLKLIQMQILEHFVSIIYIHLRHNFYYMN